MKTSIVFEDVDQGAVKVYLETDSSDDAVIKQSQGFKIASVVANKLTISAQQKQADGNLSPTVIDISSNPL